MRAIALLVAATLSSICFAGPMDPFDFKVASVVLLQVKSVQTELGVSEALRAKLNKHADWHRSQLQAMEKKLLAAQKAGKSATPDQNQLGRLMMELKRRVLGELSAAQLKRLRELSLQQTGLISLVDPDVAKKVGLSDAQRKKVATTFDQGAARAEKAQAAAVDAATKDLKNKKPKTDAEKAALQRQIESRMKAAAPKVKVTMEKIQNEVEAQVLKQLSSAQLQSWRALQGKAFSMTRR